MQICLKLVLWHSLSFNSFAPVTPMSHEIFFLAARSSLISFLWPSLYFFILIYASRVLGCKVFWTHFSMKLTFKSALKMQLLT